MSKIAKIFEQFAFTWHIENFSMWRPIKDAKIDSPEFVIHNIDNNISLFLELYPAGISNDNFVACLLGGDIKDPGLDLTGTIKIVNDISEVLISKHGFDEDCLGWKKLIEVDKLSDLIKSNINDTLTIICNLKGHRRVKQVASSCKGRTKIMVNECSFHWNVLLPKFDNAGWSETKSVIFSDLIEFQIELTLPADEVLIKIKKTFGLEDRSHFLKCKISLLDENGIELDCRKACYLLSNTAWTYPSFIKKSLLESGLFQNQGSFTLMCHISISDGKVYEGKKEYVYGASNQASLLSLQSDLLNLWTSKKHCDIELKVNNGSVKAHKSVLVARSPVFSAMFKQNMIETQTGIVCIDLDIKTVESLLEFIYTGMIERMDYEKALDLLIVGDRYEILSLVNNCCQFLIGVLSFKNVCEVLLVADKAGQNILKSAALDFITKYADKILPSIEWKQFIEQNIILGNELFFKLLNRTN